MLGTAVVLRATWPATRRLRRRSSRRTAARPRGRARQRRGPRAPAHRDRRGDRRARTRRRQHRTRSACSCAGSALPIVCLLAGDVMRWLSPFPAGARPSSTDRAPDDDGAAGPSWTAAAFLAAFTWFLLAYHRPGSPNALAVFLLAYLAAAVAGACRWGRAWLVTGEGFGALSAAVARIGLRRPRGAAPAGTAALMVSGSAARGSTPSPARPFWVDVLGTSTGLDAHAAEHRRPDVDHRDRGAAPTSSSCASRSTGGDDAARGRPARRAAGHRPRARSPRAGSSATT